MRLEQEISTTTVIDLPEFDTNNRVTVTQLPDYNWTATVTDIIQPAFSTSFHDVLPPVESTYSAPIAPSRIYSRKDFLKLSAVTGAALFLGLRKPSTVEAKSGSLIDQENAAIDQIIDGLNISDNVKDVLRGVKQYLTPVVLEYVDDNRYVVTKPTSYLIIDNDKIAYELHGDDAGMWLVKELSGTDEGKAFAQERKSLIKNNIIVPLAQAQRMSGDFLATEVGGGKLPTPGYLQNLLPDRSLVIGFDYKQTPDKKISVSSYETLGWIDVTAQKGLSIFAVMNIEELDPDLDGIFCDFGRAIMPQPFIADTVLQALIERIDWTQSDARCVIYLDPFFTEGILDLPEAVGMSSAEIEIYNRSVILHKLTVEKMRIDGAWDTQNDLIKSLKENPILITSRGQKLRIRVIYPTRAQINGSGHAGITDTDAKYLGAFDTGYVEDGFDSIPVPTIIISPDTESDDTKIPDRVDVPEIDLRSLLPPALLAALGVLSLGLLGGRHRGKGTGGQPLPAV